MAEGDVRTQRTKRNADCVRKTHRTKDYSNRVRRSNFAEDQFDILEAIGDLFSNTFANAYVFSAWPPRDLSK